MQPVPKDVRAGYVEFKDYYSIMGVDEKAPLEDIVADPVKRLEAARPKRNPRIVRPAALFPARRNSQGLLLSDPMTSKGLLSAMRWALGSHPQVAYPIVNGVDRVHRTSPVLDPADRRRQIGETGEASNDDVAVALELATQFFSNLAQLHNG